MTQCIPLRRTVSQITRSSDLSNKKDRSGERSFFVRRIDLCGVNFQEPSIQSVGASEHRSEAGVCSSGGGVNRHKVRPEDVTPAQTLNSLK